MPLKSRVADPTGAETGLVGSRLFSLPVRGPRTRWWVLPLAIFVFTRIASGILIVLIARDQISASQLPQNMPMPTLVDPPSYLHVISNWDGQWYRDIAAHGYPHGLPTNHGVVQQSAWAFYPLLPALIRLVMTAGPSFGLAASVVSLVCGALAMCLLYRMLQERSGSFTAALTVVALCVTTASPILQTAYTESLALLLLFVALWGLQQQRYAVFGAAGVLLSMTRAIAPPLALVACGVYFVRKRSADSFSPKERSSLVVSGLIVAASSMAWPIVVGAATGDAAAYVKTQAAWAKVAGNEARPWMVTMLHNPEQLSVVVVGVGLLALVCLRARAWPLALRLWPVPYAIFILAVTPATASVLRFSVLAGATWWPAPGWSRRLATPRARVALVTAVVTVGLALQWWWLRTYFVIDPYSHGHP